MLYGLEKALDKSRIKVVTVKDRKLVGKLGHDFSSGRGGAEEGSILEDVKARLEEENDDEHSDGSCIYSF
jgi:hypothetical protein